MTLADGTNRIEQSRISAKLSDFGNSQLSVDSTGQSLVKCPRCQQLEETVQELERALDGAVWVEDSVTQKLRFHLKVGHQAATIIGLLWKTQGSFVSSWALESTLKSNRDAALQGESFRHPHIVSVIVSRIRKLHGSDFIESRQRIGFRLSQRGLKVVDSILKPATSELEHV